MNHLCKSSTIRPTLFALLFTVAFAAIAGNTPETAPTARNPAPLLHQYGRRCLPRGRHDPRQRRQLLRYDLRDCVRCGRPRRNVLWNGVQDGAGRDADDGVHLRRGPRRQLPRLGIGRRTRRQFLRSDQGRQCDHPVRHHLQGDAGRQLDDPVHILRHHELRPGCKSKICPGSWDSNRH